MGIRILRGKGAVIDREFPDTQIPRLFLPFPFRINPTVHVQLVVLCPDPGTQSDRRGRSASHIYHSFFGR
jgi:hypothetical protein